MNNLKELRGKMKQSEFADKLLNIPHTKVKTKALIYRVFYRNINTILSVITIS